LSLEKDLAGFGYKQYMKYKLLSQYFIFVAIHQRPTIGIWRFFLFLVGVL
jgi:hypothetical protein